MITLSFWVRINLGRYSQGYFREPETIDIPDTVKGVAELF